MSTWAVQVDLAALEQMRSEREHKHPVVAPDKRQLVPAFGHVFNQVELRCSCGVTYTAHNRNASPCAKPKRDVRKGVKRQQIEEATEEAWTDE